MTTTVDVTAAVRAMSYEHLCNAYLELKKERDLLAQELKGLVSVMEAEGGGRWFQTKAAAYLARMQFNLREQAAKGRAVLEKVQL